MEKLRFSERMLLVEQDVRARLRDWRDRENTHINPVPLAGRNPFADVFEEMPEAPYVIAQAEAIVRSWLVTPTVIYPNEVIVGITRPLYPMLEHFSWGVKLHKHMATAENGYAPEELERIQRLYDRVTPLDYRHMHAEGKRLMGEEAYQVLTKENMYWAGGYQGHTLPSYVTLLENGLDGVLEKIDQYAALNDRDQETRDFYEANRIIVRGMMAHLEQYAAYAKKLAEENQEDAQRLLMIAENCAFVAHNKPKTLYQAIQLMWIMSLWDWVDCIGRADQFLLPFYEYSKKNGDVVPVEDSITSYMFKIWENGAHNLTLSGCKSDGTDATNELSYLFLQVLRSIHHTHPRICVRIHKDTPKPLMDLILKIWSEGMCDPSVISDTLVIPSLVDMGISLEDARDYATLGCQEIEIPGKCNTGNEDGSLNLAKVLEIAMLGGKATRTEGYQLGPVTKTFLECETFEELLESYNTQLRYFTKIHCALCRKGQEIRGANYAKLFKGIFTDGCLEKGLNHDAGGPIYGHGIIETAGLAPVADSLIAIKKLVYEQKKLTRQQLWQALQDNFQGHERIRQMLLNLAPKFGNDDPEVDALAAQLLEDYWLEIRKYETGRGGYYVGGCSLLKAGISYGKTMGAMADGRIAGEPLPSTMGPRGGADKSGLTAMLNSVAKLPLHLGMGGTTLNVILTGRMLATEELRDNIGAVMRTFLATGGCMAQITTASKEDLLDAKVHPERHGDLTVRVGGYSIQFVQLDIATQDEIIARYV